MEESLLIRLRKGERKAMEELYDNYGSVLMGVIMRYCNCREEAEDLLHESLLKILKGINDFKPAFEGAFEAWMRRIAVNHTISSIRKKKDFQYLEGSLTNETFDIYEDSGTESLPDLSHEQIIEMIQSLPEGYRMVLNLFVFEQMSHKEIAKELNISENTSKSQLAKARHLMKKKLVQMLNLEEATR